MTKHRLGALSILALTTILLISCGESSNSSLSNTTSSTTSSLAENEISADNFTFADRQVTTSKLVTYPGPALLESSAKVSMIVAGEPIFIYETRVNHGRVFTYAYSTDVAPVAIFDFEGQVDVVVTVNDVASITSAIIRPLMYGVATHVAGNTISFTLDYSGNYTLEYNDDYKTAMHIFANPIEENPIDPDNIPEDTIYLGPGMYNAGAIPVTSDMTVYIAGGAYVFGQIRGEGIENITIRGRGIIAGELFDRTSENQFTIPLQMRTSRNIIIEGITFLDPAGWTMALYKSSDILLDNIKIITSRGNGDGVSVQSCTNFEMRGGFVRSWDDSLVVKNSDRGSTSNVLFDGVVVWTDLAQSMEVGYETYGPTMNNVVFQNIVVIHNFHKAAMSIHNCDDALITNVIFRNITVEDGQMLGDNRTDGEDDYLIDMTIAYHPTWTKSAGIRGNIDGVLFENVKVLHLENTIISRLNGESSASSIKNITFKDIQVAGVGVTNATTLKLVTNEFTSGLVYSYSAINVMGAIFELPYHLNLANSDVDITSGEAIEQAGLIVPEFGWKTGDLPYAGVAASGDFIAMATHGVGNISTTPVDDGTGPNEETGHEGNLVIDGNRETSWRSKQWNGGDLEFAGLTIEFGNEQKYVGQIRLLGLQDNRFSFEHDIQVWGRKMSSDGVTPSTKYVRILSTRTFSLTPLNGNSIDINITAQQYFGLQLRVFRKTGYTAQAYVELAEVEFYSPSLTFNKAVVDSTPHADVYPSSKITDGDPTGTSYYEAASMPAYVVVDMESVYSIQSIVMALPPSLLWDARTQTIEILISSSNSTYSSVTTTFTTLVAATPYLFDPINGNNVTLTLNTATSARFIKLVFTSNSAVGGYGAQLSELSVYGS